MTSLDSKNAPRSPSYRSPQSVSALRHSGIPQNDPKLRNGPEHDLDRAILSGNHDVAQRLLALANEDGSDNDSDRYRRVEMAVIQNDPRMLQIILSNGGLVSTRLQQALSAVLRGSHRNATSHFTGIQPRAIFRPALIQQPCTDDAVREQLLSLLSRNQDTVICLRSHILVKKEESNLRKPLRDGLRRLIKVSGRGVGGEVDSCEVLRKAVANGDYEKAKLLLDEGVDINKGRTPSCTPLLEAVKMGDERMIQLMLQNQENVDVRNENGTKALELAIRQNNHRVVNMLLSRDVTVAGRCGVPSSVFEAAVRKGSPPIVTTLLEHGADVNIKGRNGFTPLEVAVVLGECTITELLIRHGADMNVGHGAPLRDAVWRGDVALTKMLLDWGADINAQGPKKHLALETAVLNGDQELALLLLSKGSDVTKCGRSNRTVLDTAINRGDEAMRALLANASIQSNDTASIPVRPGRLSLSEPVSCAWEIPSVLGVRNGSGHMLAGALTLVAVKRHVEAWRCEDYVKATYGSPGIELLRSLMEALDSPHGVFDSNDVSIRTTPTQVTIVKASHEMMIDALFWICLAVRLPVKGSVTLSTGYLDCGREKAFVLRPLFTPPENKAKCWYGLFNSAVIVKDHGVDPPDENCLEVDFSTMVTLSAVEYTVRVGSGLVLMGYSTALIPVQLLDDDTILWHLETCPHENQFKTNELGATEKGWLQTLDVEFLKTKKARIGWCPEVVSLLGTSRLPPTVSWSDAQDKPTTWHWRGANLQFIAQAASPIQIGAQAGATFELVTNSVRYSPSTNYLNLLRSTTKQQILLYDTTSKRAYMVSLLSVLLHMAVVYHAGLDSDQSFPYAAAQSDGAQASLEILQQNGGRVIERQAEHRLTVRDLIMGFSSNLAKLPLQKPGKDKIYGYEFMDIVHTSPISELKRVSISKKSVPWRGLLGHLPCLFCSDLGDAIIGPRSTAPAAPCNSLPVGQDYLAAPVRCMNELARKSGDRGAASSRALPGGLFWNISGNPFAYCSHDPQSGIHCWHDGFLLQDIRTKRDLDIRPGANIPADGAVVFGRQRGQSRDLRRKSLRPVRNPVSGYVLRPPLLPFSIRGIWEVIGLD